MDVSWLTTCMNFKTPPLAQIAHFDARFASRGRKHVCQLKAFKAITAWSWKSVCSSSVILARYWALDWGLKIVRQIGRSISPREVSKCLLFLPCSLLLRCTGFACCRHDPIIVRIASNFSTIPLILCIRLDVHDQHSQLSVSVSVLVSPYLHRSSLWDVFCTHTYLGSLYSYRVCNPFNQIHHRRFAFIWMWRVGSMAL